MSTIIEIDTSSAIEEVIRLEKEIESYNRLTKQLESENKNLVKGMQDLATQGGSNTEQYRQMNQRLVENRKILVENNTARGVLSDSVKNLNKQMESAYRLQTNESQSLNAMRKNLIDLRVIYDNLEDKESDYAHQVLTDINAMNEAVKAQEEQQGIYSRNVGDYYRDVSKTTGQAATSFRGMGNVATAVSGSLNAVGVQSKIAEGGIKGFTIAQTALTGVSRVSNSVAKAGGIQTAINTTLESLREKQQQRLALATTAQTTAQNANNFATKAAAVATYLWNAALSANPILLIITAVATLATGIGFLIKRFSDSEKAQKKINEAMEGYEELGREREMTDKRISNASAELAQENANLLDNELNSAKLRGASARELQLIQEKANIKQIENNRETAKQNLLSAKTELKGKTEIVKKLESLGDKLNEEQKKQLEDYRKSIEDLTAEIPALELAVNAFPQALKNAETEALISSREYAKERAKIAKDVEKIIEDTAISTLENSQKKAIEQRKISAKREIEDIKNNEEYSANQKAKLIKASTLRLNNDLSEINQTNLRSEFQKQAKSIEDKIKLEIEGQKQLNQDTEDLELESENLRYQNLLKANELRKEEEKYTDIELQNLEVEHQNKITAIRAKSIEDRANIERLAWENAFYEKENALVKALADESDFTRLNIERLNEEKNSLRESDFKNQESYKKAILELDRAITEEQLELIQQVNAEQQAQMASFAELFGATSELLQELGGDMSAFGGFSKSLAMVEIAINSAKAISGAISGGMDLPFPANLAAVATGIAAVTANIASAKKILNSAGEVPKYAHGGFVGGNSRNGDKVPIMANSGELVLNAEQQRIFEVIGNQNTTIDYELMYGAFSRAIAEMKAPTVVYSEFVDFQNNLATFDENSKITM